MSSNAAIPGDCGADSLARARFLSCKGESLRTMAMGVAHDYNNLIAAIVGNAQLMQQKTARGLPVDRHMDLLLEAADMAVKLTDQILACSGRVPLKPAALDLSHCAREAAETLARTLPSGAQLEYKLPDALPLVHADPQRVHQMMFCLVENAVEALAGSAGTITITAGTMACDRDYLAEPPNPLDATPGAYAYAEVSDTGRGLSPEEANRMFDPFFTTKIRGQGLGLPVVAGLARAHKGAVRWWTTPGKGTTFRVLLPLAVRKTGAA